MRNSNCRFEVKDGYFQVFEPDLITEEEEPTFTIFMDKENNFYMASREEGFVKLTKK